MPNTTKTLRGRGPIPFTHWTRSVIWERYCTIVKIHAFSKFASKREWRVLTPFLTLFCRVRTAAAVSCKTIRRGEGAIFCQSRSPIARPLPCLPKPISASDSVSPRLAHEQPGNPTRGKQREERGRRTTGRRTTGRAEQHKGVGERSNERASERVNDRYLWPIIVYSFEFDANRKVSPFPPVVRVRSTLPSLTSLPRW